MIFRRPVLQADCRPGIIYARTENGQVVEADAAFAIGADAFRLTKRIVADHVYKRTRNPMSLGFYLFTLAVGLSRLVVLVGFISTYIFS